MLRLLCGCLLLATLTGCDSQEYGQCEAPEEHLEVLFKPANPVHPFSHSFCLVCNTEIEVDAYLAWAESMGASGNIEKAENFHPCLYVYGDGEDIASLEECQALVCEGGANYADMVSKKQGNVNVKPLLDADKFIAHEWVLTHEQVELSPPLLLSSPPTTQAD